MSEVTGSSTPKRQAIVHRLRRRIESFRKHHDNCRTRLEESQPSRELKEQEETRLLHMKFLENKGKMNPKIRHDQVSKISKQGVNNVGQEKSASNTVGQHSMKRLGDSPQPQMEGERSLQNADASLVPKKCPRFDGSLDVHVKVNSPNFTGSGDKLPSKTSMAFASLNGHTGDFSKSEELSKPVVSPYSGSCENIDRMMTRVSQQYTGNYPSLTVTNRGQPSTISDSSINPDYSVNFKQESDLLNSDVAGTTSISNGFSNTCTKSDGELGRLLTDYADNPKSKDDDLKTQISQFERVLDEIKNREGNFNESDVKKDTVISSKKPSNPSSSSLVNGLSDSVSYEGAKTSNQLNLSNGPNNGTQLPTATVTSSTNQQHGISRSTAEAIQQYVRAQKEERLASKGPFEKPLFLNPTGVGRGQNSTGISPRQSNYAPIRQLVYEQIQRRTNQQRAKIHTSQTPQLHARNPTMNPLSAPSPYQMHTKLRYTNMAVNTGQPVSSYPPNERAQQNRMAHVHPSPIQQEQSRGQLQNMSQHQINIYAQQQRVAFQRQLASRLPSYSQTQNNMMDMRQKFPGGVPMSHTAQYPLQQQATRNPQALSHLQHYPNAYRGQTGPMVRSSQAAFMGERSRYQNPYTNNLNQENKMHPVYQRYASVDDSLTPTRYHNQDGRSSYSYQRSTSLPAHTGPANNVFNQSSPPVVRLDQTKTNLPDMNNNGSEHGLNHLPQPPLQQASLTHLKQQHISQANMNQGQIYQASEFNQNRPQTTTNLQHTISNSFSNLLDLKSNSESSLFTMFVAETSGENADSTDFDSMLKSPPSDFNLLNILDGEPQKALQ